MSCGCENKKKASELARVSELARKTAVMEQRIIVVEKKEDGTYTFHSTDSESKGVIIEYRHYL